MNELVCLHLVMVFMMQRHNIWAVYEKMELETSTIKLIKQRIEVLRLINTGQRLSEVSWFQNSNLNILMF